MRKHVLQYDDVMNQQREVVYEQRRSVLEGTDISELVREWIDETVEAARSRTEVILGVVRAQQPTLRQLLAILAGARGHFTTAGTPEQIADLMEGWVADGAADGFNLMPPLLPSMLQVFIDEVVPILQRRGLFRRAYEGQTLRDHYGLARPTT